MARSEDRPQQGRLVALTVGFHETMFLDDANIENMQISEFGHSAFWNGDQLREFGVISGPENPQNMNRYAYGENSPIGKVDPSGHDSKTGDGTYFYQDLTREEAQAFVDKILGSDTDPGLMDTISDLTEGFGVVLAALLGIGMFAAGAGAIAALLLGLGAAMIIQVANSLVDIAEDIKDQLEADSEIIRVEITSHVGGAMTKVIVHGNLKEARATSISFTDPTSHILYQWMFWSDYTYDARSHQWWQINHMNTRFGR